MHRLRCDEFVNDVNDLVVVGFQMVFELLRLCDTNDNEIIDMASCFLSHTLSYFDKFLSVTLFDSELRGEEQFCVAFVEVDFELFNAEAVDVQSVF